MNSTRWQRLKKLARLLVTPDTDLRHQSERIRFMEQRVGLPVKLAVVIIISYFLFVSNWLVGLTSIGQVALEPVRGFFIAYAIINTGVAGVLMAMERLHFSFVQWVVAINNVIDGLFVAAVVIVTGGLDSLVYWFFLALIVRNAVSFPVAIPQIVLNLLVTGSYVLAGLLYGFIVELEPASAMNPLLVETGRTAFGIFTSQTTELFVVRIFLLLFMTVCCYGVQALSDRERRADEDALEYSTRQEQLQTAGRLAAEIAHQIKNPLGIINNAAFSLERALKSGSAEMRQQVELIREEVARADRIITELMGYAQLAEGRVEKLDIAAELDEAINAVFPSGTEFAIQIHRQLSPDMPNVFMQRKHLQEIFINVIQNARDVLDGKGNIWIIAAPAENESARISIRDDGPGIPPDKHERIFEPYFSMRPKGTGLGLAIVKHNTELYGGTVRVESELGQGARFVLQLPSKAVVHTRK